MGVKGGIRTDSGSLVYVKSSNVTTQESAQASLVTRNVLRRVTYRR